MEEELIVLDWFAFVWYSLGGFPGFSDLFNSFDGYVKLSGFVPTAHVRVEALNSMLFLESSDLLREMQEVSSLSEIPSDLEQLDFAHE